MAKFAGLGLTLHIDDASGTPVEISDWVSDFSVNNSFGEQDVSSLSQFAMDRLQLTEDDTLSITMPGAVGDDTLMPVFFTTPRLPAAGRTVTIGYPNDWGYSFEAMIFSRNISRGQGGALSLTVEMRLTGGTAGTWEDCA